MAIRVAFVLYLKDSFGGAERRFIRIYNKLASDYEDIVCNLYIRCCNKKTTQNILRRADCKIDNIKSVQYFSNNYKCLLHLMFSNQYDVIHFFDTCRFDIFALLVTKVRNKKSIYSICRYMDAYQKSSTETLKKVKLQMKLANYVDLLYPSGKQYLKNSTKENKIRITPGTFTDLMLFKPERKKKIMLFAAARLEDEKNPKLLLDAVKICQNSIREYDYKIIILGKGNQMSLLQNFALNNHINDIILMTGFDRTSKYMPYANVFFSLQKLENYPSQSLAEATACGCYVIITDVGDSRKCADESFGVFIEQTPQCLANAIQTYLIKSEKDKLDIVENARNYALVHYDIKDSVRYYADLFKV